MMKTKERRGESLATGRVSWLVGLGWTGRERTSESGWVWVGLVGWMVVWQGHEHKTPAAPYINITFFFFFFLESFLL